MTMALRVYDIIRSARVLNLIGLIGLIGASSSPAQDCVTPTDNYAVTSGSVVTLCPGTYLLDDVESDGVIQIRDAAGVTIDGSGVRLQGTATRGYGILIQRSSRVTLRNFAGLSGYFYAIRVENSDSVVIEHCSTEGNAGSYAGFIDVWSDVDQAHGGGVLFDHCRGGSVTQSSMKTSNDGIALYYSSHMQIADNDLSGNSAYAIRMFFTDSCDVLRNNASHVYREDPVNSDAAAILMIIANANRVEHNDFSYSSDGIFLGQYGYSATPNNNLFQWNDCSYSPHNAIEATFAGGNIFRHNKANYSGYGLWLGYSFNTLVDSNEVIGNHEALSVGTAGIAIDRGFNNRITHNTISDNATGVLLWEGDPIPGYAQQYSESYTIDGNAFSGNGRAVDAHRTTDLWATANVFARNYEAILLRESMDGAQVKRNEFGPTVAAWIRNDGPSSVDARDNSFPTADTSFINGKIFDAADNPACGAVTFTPFLVQGSSGVETAFPPDLAEPGASQWSVFASDGAESTLRWDSLMVRSGAASLHLMTASGYDVNIHRWSPDSGRTIWNLAGSTALSFWLRAENSNDGLFQEFSISLGNDAGGTIVYSGPVGTLNQGIGTWKEFVVPLGGSSLWSRTNNGHVSLDSIAYVEIHLDTWGGGFVVRVDGLTLEPATSTPPERDSKPSKFSLGQNYPNPFNPATTVEFSILGTQYTTLKVYDILGQEVAVLVHDKKEPGNHTVRFEGSGLASGVYLYRLTAGSFVQTRKMLLVR
jgi:nitrous oxidase accessory protein NosD